MTGDDEDVSMYAIEKARTLHRSLAAKCQEHGLSREDVTIAGLYSAFDLASDLTGSRLAAVAWLRKGLAAIEAQVLREQETMQ